jgi:hypothetical protein
VVLTARPVLRAGAALLFVVVASACLLTAAVLVPAPPVALPIVVLTCLGCPIAGALDLGAAIAVARAPAVQLRRELDRLPEAPHPLGY